MKGKKENNARTFEAYFFFPIRLHRPSDPALHAPMF
jgi:hypothetical protein